MTIWVDHDQVLAQWAGEVVRRWNNDPAPFEPVRRIVCVDDITSFKLGPCLGIGGPEFVDRLMENCRDLYDHIAPVAGAIAAMEVLNSTQRVKIATAIPKQAAHTFEGKMRWFHRHMPFLTHKQIVAIDEKAELGGSRDILVDDGPHNLEAWAATGRCSITFDCPWNRDREYPNSLRAYSWLQALEQIDLLQRTMPFVD